MIKIKKKIKTQGKKSYLELGDLINVTNNLILTRKILWIFSFSYIAFHNKVLVNKSIIHSEKYNVLNFMLNVNKIIFFDY